MKYGVAVKREQPATDLARHIEQTPLVDTHEHLRREAEWLDEGPDILQDLFDHYVRADLHTAGASAEAMRRLMDASDPDIAARFRGIEAAWQATRFTGYGEAVRMIASRVYGLDELTADGLASAAGRTAELRRPGDFLRRFIHAVPVNKLFAFGGDTSWPTAALAYAGQARRGIRRALAAEVADGDLTEGQAMAIATRIMRANQYACFDVPGTRANIRAAAGDTA